MTIVTLNHDTKQLTIDYAADGSQPAGSMQLPVHQTGEMLRVLEELLNLLHVPGSALVTVEDGDSVRSDW